MGPRTVKGDELMRDASWWPGSCADDLATIVHPLSTYVGRVAPVPPSLASATLARVLEMWAGGRRWGQGAEAWRLRAGRAWLDVFLIERDDAVVVDDVPLILPGVLSAGGVVRVRVQLIASAWSAFAVEVAIRPRAARPLGPLVLPGYFRAASAVLDALAVRMEREARLDPALAPLL